MSKYSIVNTPAAVMTELVVKIRKLRKSIGISQLELAIKSGVSFGSIKRFEATGQISLEALLKIAYFFDRLEDFTPVFRADNNLEAIEKLFSDKTR